MTEMQTNAEKSDRRRTKIAGLIGLFAFLITVGMLAVGAVIGITKLASMIWRYLFGS